MKMKLVKQGVLVTHFVERKDFVAQRIKRIPMVIVQKVRILRE